MVDAPHREYMEAREETGQRWAWSRADEQLVRIGPGDADRLKPRCASGELVCPLEDCLTPRFSAVIGHRRGKAYVEDLFRHVNRPPIAHTPESVAHVHGKLLVRRWLEDAGAASVELERRDTQARRTPDVTAVLADGTHVAIEVQYSGLSARTWRARDGALRDAGHTTTWLFGIHTDGIGARTASRSLSQVNREVLDAGGRVWWLDVERAEIAASAVERTIGDDTMPCTLVEDPGAPVRLLWAPVSAHVIDGGTLTSPHDEHLAENNARWAAHVARLEELRRQMLDNEQRRAATRPTMRPSSAAVWATPAPEYRPPAWAPRADLVSELRSAGGVAAAALDFSDPDDDAVVGNPVAWHAAVVDHFVVDRAYGNTFGYNQVYDFVKARWQCDSGAGRAIWHFLDHLVAVGVLRGSRMRYGIGDEAPTPSRATPTDTQVSLF